MNTATVSATKATLTLDGQQYDQDVPGLEDARVAIVQAVHEHARSYPCRIVVTDPEEGVSGLEFAEDGSVQPFDPDTETSTKEVSSDADTTREQAVPVLLDDDHDDELLSPVPTRPRRQRARPAQAPAAEVTEQDAGPVEHESDGKADAPATSRGSESSDVPSASDFFATKPATEEGPAQKGWRGALNSWGLRLAPSQDELEERAATRDVQRGVTSHKTVMVANLKGGSGKTTVTYLLAAVLGRVRGGTVLAWDNNENRGTLAYRSPYRANTASTAIDLLREQDFFEGSGQVAELVNFVRPQGSNKFDLLASQDQGSDRPVIDGEGFESLHSLLQTFYRMIIVDTGNASNASTWQAAAKISDQIVIVCANAEDSAQTAAETIDALIKSGHGATVKNSVALVVDAQPQRDKAKRQAAEQRLQRITDHFSHHVRAVHVLPWETTLNDGERIEWESLSKRTHKVMLNAAASIMNGM